MAGKPSSVVVEEGCAQRHHVGVTNLAASSDVKRTRPDCG